MNYFLLNKLKINGNNNKKNTQNANLMVEAESPNDNRKKILIIDDHFHVRETLKNLINKYLVNNKLSDLFKVEEGRDGSDIISSVIKDQFDHNLIKCIITDENMEFINGSEAIKILKMLERKNKIKKMIIASITAFEDEMNKNIIRDAGADYILPKPCSDANLNKFFSEFKIFEAFEN